MQTEHEIPTTNGILKSLTKNRIIELGRVFDVSIPSRVKKEAQIDTLLASQEVNFANLLGHLKRDELKAVCRENRLDDKGRSRKELVHRLIEARGDTPNDSVSPLFAGTPKEKFLPEKGDVVHVRNRQYLVTEVHAATGGNGSGKQTTLVKLVCLDDDNQGRPLEVIWELELGAKVIHPEAVGLGEITHIDPPRHFAAYLHALKWNAVTATDAELFQAPFRSGIKLLNHQLSPLKKALSLPRANLFIADDVGLGKTIEAGLVLQELLLRQQVRFALIVCPAAIALQWQGEMQKRFGLHFEVYNRTFVARRRQERGFGINPWSTHTRFIISYQLLRRPEYRDPLLQCLGERVTKSLLVLDEAHTAAPASESSYAVDSRITKVVRDVAPRFENRLFLSATPHNGHSNSFSALLELLDPQRFTRGVPIKSADQLTPIMTRRLKRDLAEMGDTSFPTRRIIQFDLQHDGQTWFLKQGAEPAAAIGKGEPVELELSRLLTDYTTLMKPKKGRGRLVFVNLQKRLLSSIEAFFRTLHIHRQSVANGKAATALSLTDTLDEDERGLDDAAQEDILAKEMEQASGALDAPKGQAKALLERMIQLAGQYRSAPDAKIMALVHWLGAHLCPGIGFGSDRSKVKSEWTDRRVIIFTEYGDTKRYLKQMLSAAIQETELADERIMDFHGGMSDEQRETVQHAFNTPPHEHPVRILLCTDAAREGVNLQGHCADLFHFDIPWNPARMEQRNGRIDRTLQPAAEVRCHYFFYPDRSEDIVLKKVVYKVDVIKNELGSLGDVVMKRLSDALEPGIDDTSEQRIAAAEQMGEKHAVVTEELETQRLAPLKKEIDENGRILNKSQKVMDFDARLLRDALDVSLMLSGMKPLKRAGTGDDNQVRYLLPEMPDAWQKTVDTLRPPRKRDEPFWEWRKTPPVPVVFEPPSKMTSQVAQLHLQHPLVQRLMARFLAQGYGAHDLSRVTMVHNRHDAIARVIAIGRLTLFGEGAGRLHEAIITVAAKWLENQGKDHLRPFADKADRAAVERLEQIFAEEATLHSIGPRIESRLRAAAPNDFAALWPHIKTEADSRAHEAEQQLRIRGQSESAALRDILNVQKTAIQKTLKERRQLPLKFTDSERKQWEQETQYMERRLQAIDREIEQEPRQITDVYRVMLRRLEPVGLVYLWPTTRG